VRLPGLKVDLRLGRDNPGRGSGRSGASGWQRNWMALTNIALSPVASPPRA